MTSHPDHSDELTILLTAIRLACGSPPFRLGSDVSRHSTASGASDLRPSVQCGGQGRLDTSFAFTADGALGRAIAGDFVDFGGGGQ